MLRLMFFGGHKPSRVGMRRPSATLATSASDVEMASQPRRRFIGDGLHRAEETRPLLNDKIFEVEGVEYSHRAITGSIYRVLAFRTPTRTGPAYDGLFFNFAFYVAFVQLCAPMLMLWYAMKRIDWSKSRIVFVAADLWHQKDGYEKISIMTLGYMFLVPFLANLCLTCKKNIDEYVRLRAVSLYLEEHGNFCVSMVTLTWGCVVHCLITPMIMLVTWYLTATSSSPIDITMNMLGLTFVIGMDQLAADFADTLGYYEWDDQKTGDFVYDTLHGKSIRDGGGEFQIDDPDDQAQYPKLWWCCVSNIFNWSLMTIILIGLFSFYQVEEVESESEKELAALRATVANLTKLSPLPA